MTDAPTANVFAFGPVDGFNEPHPDGSYVRLCVDKQVVRISRGAAEVLAAELLGVIGKLPDPGIERDLPQNVEQRLLGMKFSKPIADYDLGYNDAVDDALRAFTEAVAEVREAT